MRQRVIYILKHNERIQRVYRVFMSIIFRLWGLFIRTDNNLVMFVSFMGMNFNDSPKAIYDYMQCHKEYQKYHCVWAFEHPEKFRNLNMVTIDTAKYFYLAIKAKYWITNTNIERGLEFKKKRTIYLNTWHGIALKHIGNDCPGRKDYNFNTLNYLVVSGDYDEKVFRSAFSAKETSYLRCGMPRNEELWCTTDNDRLEMRKKLDLPKDKIVILYAPTWRESTDGGKSYTIKPPIHFVEWEKELGKHYVVLFRAHHQTNKVLGIQYNSFVRNVSDYPAVNDLMIAADILITDYSAIAFDYSILCKPIICYAYDYDSYLSERGTYFDVDEKYPNKSCRTEKELLSRIKSIDYSLECENSKRFRDEFIQYGVGATEICAKAVFSTQ